MKEGKIFLQYPGVVQLIERGIWDAEVVSLSLATRTIENRNL